MCDERFLAVPAFARVVNKLLMGSTKGHPKGPLFMGVGNADFNALVEDLVE